MKNFINISLLSAVIIIMASCSQTTRRPTTTEIATATGGIIGGSLGAIVGNQVGNSGAGFLIGAVTGSGTGALIGQKLQGQEDQLALQDARIRQQERKIQIQDDNIQEMRQMREGYDHNNTVSQNSWGNSKTTETIQAARNTGTHTNYVDNTHHVDNTDSGYRFKEKNIVVQDTRADSAKGSYHWGSESKDLSYDPSSEECIRADTEVVSAQGSIDISDKLYHQRRALRLCPNNPNHHNGLGEIYISLNRDEDAKYEFNEALKLDSTHEAASRNIALVQ